MNHRGRKAATKTKKKKTNKGDDKNNRNIVQEEPPSWVDSILSFESDAASTSAASQLSSDHPRSTPLSVLSWNVLAHSYCSRKAQCHLPLVYQKHVFHAEQRRRKIVEILHRFTTTAVAGGRPPPREGQQEEVDVMCLQEVDLNDIQQTMHNCGYKGIETPRTEGGGAGGRVDSCAIYVRDATWQIVEHELIRLDDLATLSSWSESDTSLHSVGNDSSEDDPIPISNNNNNLQGLQQNFLRRNIALLARIQHKSTGETVVVANCHLYWHPGYEFVKLCQTHYILLRARRFCRVAEPFLICGDFNSKPNGAVHTYLSRGVVNAKQYAPWYRIYDPDLEEDKIVDGSDPHQQLNQLTTQVQQLNVSPSKDDDDDAAAAAAAAAAVTSPRYILDATLNKLCRWLRILGQDTALETEVEEKQRTREGKMVLFERCRSERRTLVTTSTRLQQRTECPPGTYVINPTNLDKLETTLVHILLTHGVVLEPDSFLSRCVICNGGIQEVTTAEDKKRILQDYEAPVALLKEDLEVYQCDGCQQGYWWCDRPTSSASRVKGTATRLFEICLRAGVPIRGESDMFDHVNVKELQSTGWDFSSPGSELLQQKLEVIAWLRNERLECPFRLESAYARRTDGNVCGERLPFTNVTYSFVNTLDYIFISSDWSVMERLKIPTSFPELNTKGIEQGHLLPSDVWPSDHLCIGAKLLLKGHESVRNGILAASPSTEDSKDLICAPLGSGTAIPPAIRFHGQRCDCGCVPNIPSLFEMAERRKQALREKKSKK